jgi:hypothetical protein
MILTPELSLLKLCFEHLSDPDEIRASPPQADREYPA